ncbi:hypothetical protein DUNSADRAFT_17650 [Dunaliella salina]|uniref:Uncharacterized protein n=1 Tax=Dunaliella salina TaxID=3046 RepID=A0ABQ7G1D9_DUNSA|nr:hypothetical protein DUNSADRAFT_17650 [Dunaliella salina]|eukprot:KAF5828415.1 hypothetical protein DUNSADRAFT_17650 [Dunaliella salina]
MDDMDLYADLGLSNSADGFAKQHAVLPPEIPASAGSAWELSNKVQQGADQPLAPAPEPSARGPTPPTSFLPGSVSSIAAPQQPSQAPVSGAQAAVLAYQDAEVKELKGMVKKLQQEAAEASEKLHKQEEQLRTLESERSVLVRNISTIYRTAMMELGRKNTEIKGLRMQLEQQQQQQQPPQQQPPQQQKPLSTESTVLPPPPSLPAQPPHAPASVTAAAGMPQPPLVQCTLESRQQGFTQSTRSEPGQFQGGERRRSSSGHTQQTRVERDRHCSREPEVARRGSEERAASRHDGRSRSGDAWVSESKRTERGQDSRERKDEGYERRRDGSRQGKDTHGRLEGSGLFRERDFGGRGRGKEEVEEGEDRSRAARRDRDRERGDRAGRRGEAEETKRHSSEDAVRKRGRS